jgi:hypothetical protein
VRHALLVGVGDRGGDVVRDALRLRLGERRGRQPVRERAAREVLVDGVRLAVLLALVEERDDRRMRQPRPDGVAGRHPDEHVATKVGVGRPPARAAELLEQRVPSGDPPLAHGRDVPRQPER